MDNYLEHRLQEEARDKTDRELQKKDKETTVRTTRHKDKRIEALENENESLKEELEVEIEALELAASLLIDYNVIEIEDKNKSDCLILNDVIYMLEKQARENIKNREG